MRVYDKWIGLINGPRTSAWGAAVRTWLSRPWVNLGLAALLVALLIVINELNFFAASEASQKSLAVAQRQAGIYDLQRLLLDAETGQRGYLLTGDTKYLLPYTQAVAAVDPALDRLRLLVVKDHLLMAEFAVLSRAMARKLAELEVTIHLRQSGAEDQAWQTVTETGLGRQYMEAVRTAAEALLASTVNDLAIQNARVQKSLLSSRLSVLISAVFGLLAFSLYLRGSAKLHQAAQKRAYELLQENDKLESLVEVRTVELERLANHLINVQEGERERLARELHDELGSLLTAAKFDVARVKSRLPADPPELHERLSHLTSMLNAGIAIKRKIIEDLRPSSLAHLGLPAALDILTKEYRTCMQLSVDVSVDEVALNDVQQLAVYRLVQEALTNIAKHAQATRVQVLVKNYGNHIEVEIGDDGVGFDTRQTKISSHGLAGMRQRMHALKGRLQVDSAVGRGTTVRAILPLGIGPAAEVSSPQAV